VSFAETFDKILRSIMDQKLDRPHIRKVGPIWECSSVDGRRGFGSTPQQAWSAWRNAAVTGQPRDNQGSTDEHTNA
jgi:hypothetical protein